MFQFTHVHEPYINNSHIKYYTGVNHNGIEISEISHEKSWNGQQSCQTQLLSNMGHKLVRKHSFRKVCQNTPVEDQIPVPNLGLLDPNNSVGDANQSPTHPILH